MAWRHCSIDPLAPIELSLVPEGLIPYSTAIINDYNAAFGASEPKQHEGV